MSEPTSGPITTELATAYIVCAKEVLYNNQLYLVYGITVQVGKGRPFQEADEHFSDIDPDQLVYPIRGSLVKLQCDSVSEIMQNAGKNCRAYAEPKATGTCYRTTFNDWSCNMTDSSADTKPIRDGMAPPQ